MKNANILTLFVILLNSTFLSAATLTGTVADTSTSKPIENVNVTLAGTNMGAATDSQGRFAISNVPPAAYDVSITCMGYESKLITGVKVSEATQPLVVKLAPMAVEMPGVRIEADRFDPRFRTELSRQDLFTLKARNVYKTAGTLDDISRTVQMQGSVVPGGDYTSFYAVRGGSPDQNIVMMDGVLFPNPYRLRMALGGGLSVFNPHAVSDVNLQVGHFSAEYGDFMSSVLGVESRTGSTDHTGFGGNINILNSNIYAEGPILDTGGSWIASIRRTYFDLVAERFDDSQTSYPQTMDYTAKIVMPLNDRNRVEFNLLHSQEDMDLDTEEFENLLLNESADIDLYNLSYKGLWTDNIYETVHMAFYDETFKYHIKQYDDYNPSEAGYDSKINNFMIKEDLSVELGKNHWINRGFYFSTMESNMDYFAEVNEIAFSRRVLPPEINYSRRHNLLAAYFDYTVNLTKRLQTRAGVRYDYSSLVEKGHTSPRVSMMYKINNSLSVNGFWGLCYQYPNVMSIFNRDWPLALDVVEEELDAERAEHRVVGVKWRLSELLSAQVDLYQKVFTKLLLPMDFQDFIPENNGNGESKGVEVILQTITGPTDRWHAMLSYSLAKSEYKIMERWVPYNYDRRHGLTAMADYKLSERWSASLTWRYASGLPYYEMHQFIDANDIHNSFIRSFDNLERLPSYQRLDMRVNYRFKMKGMACSAYLDLTNILNRKNIYDVIWYSSSENLDEHWDSYNKTLYRRNIYMMPFVPSLGVSFQY